MASDFLFDVMYNKRLSAPLLLDLLKAFDSISHSIINKNRVTNSFDRNTLRTIISALVLSKLFYTSTVWSNTTDANIKKLQAVQNFSCRIITKAKEFEHIKPVLREIKCYQ